MRAVRRKKPPLCPDCAILLVKNVCPTCGFRKPSRRRSIKCEMDGYRFDSLTERNFYRDTLKPRLAAGEITAIVRPVPRLYLDVAGRRVGWYTGDFLVVGADGSETIIETKGHAEKDFRYRWLLVQVLYDGRYSFEYVGAKEPKFIKRAAIKRKAVSQMGKTPRNPL